MKTEKIFFIIGFIGFVLKTLHIPGGSVLCILAISTLSLFYFPLGFYFLSDKKIDSKTIVFSIIIGLMFSTLLIGILFKVMHWPGAAIMILVGLLSTIPVAIFSGISFKNSMQEEQKIYYKNIFIRSVAFLFFGVILFFT